MIFLKEEIDNRITDDSMKCPDEWVKLTLESSTVCLFDNGKKLQNIAHTKCQAKKRNEFGSPPLEDHLLECPQKNRKFLFWPIS